MTPLPDAPPVAAGTSNKKPLIGIIALVGGLCLLVAMFVGGIAGFALYSIGHSEAAETAKLYLRRNEQLRQHIGAVRDFGVFVPGSINAQNGDGSATLTLKVLGARQTVHATVQLAYRNGRQWIVTGAHYTDNAGRNVMLLNPYDSTPDAEPTGQQGSGPPAGNVQPTSATQPLRVKPDVTR